MRAHLKLTAAGLFALALSGCPVTDDYFIDTQAALGGSSQQGGTGGDGAQAGTKPAQAGSGATAGAATGGSGGGDTLPSGGAPEPSAGGAPEPGQAGDTGNAGAPPMQCIPQTERCNGHDDNCNDVVDEQACNSQQNGTQGCAGFVLAARPDHGYMLCTGTQRDYSHAQEACATQDMRLAWIESADENTGLSTKLDALSNDVEVLIGANDIANEGAWLWDGGAQFWSGTNLGKPVNGRFAAWTSGTPNNGNGSEDCGVLSSGTATWGDRNCSGKYGYLCEEAEP